MPLKSALNNLEKSALTYSFPQLSVVQMGEMRAEFPMLIFAAKEVPDLRPCYFMGFSDSRVEKHLFAETVSVCNWRSGL